MRALIVLATSVSLAAALLLAACGNNDHTDNTQKVDENLSAENIVSNDVTAIDAVTGDAANMAAESDLGSINAVAEPDQNSAAPGSAKGKEAPKSATPPARPQSHTAANSASNTQ